MDQEATTFFDIYPSRKLNLGCGTDIRDGYTNIDMHEYGRSNTLVGDIADMPDLPRSAFDEIVAWDILEHIRHQETIGVLFEWNRLLAVGGRLNIRTTFINGLIRLMERPEYQGIAHQQMLLTNLFSRQLIKGDYHLNAFTEPMMKFYLWSTGFSIESLTVKDGWIWDVWASKTRDLYEDDLAIAAGDDIGFIERSYQAVLGRSPDASGLDTYASLLGHGMTRPALVRSLWVSDEHQHRLREAAPLFEVVFGFGQASSTGATS